MNDEQPRGLPPEHAPARKAGGAASAKPTLKTIAEITGFAVTTVSRALADAPQIALETRRKVRAAADAIGYLPDRAAQRLRTGRTNVISLVLDPHEEILGYATSVISGLSSALRGTAYHLVITPHFSDTPDADPVRHILRNRMADGMVFSRTEPQDERIKLLNENGFPFVCHGRTELASPHPYVDYDNFGFAYQAVKKLIAAGCNRLWTLLPPERFTFCHHMRHGFMTAVREEGVAFEIASGITLDNSPHEIQSWLLQRLGQDDRPDGLLCGGETSAMAAIAAVHDRGLTLGRDIHLVAKQTSGIFDQIRPAVPVVYEDLEAAGRLMGEILLKRISGVTDMTELQVVQPAV
ncbi:LacI family transcriptional regulator [Rhizobium halophytocola]|uniref:LacI family transcriptional regulator n=1 Tax=Rhizobium halophytocola TaxID=735519 RepID=A0ABS4E690_9HYPH|nr:LacI family transcriptional regulator [Rhizobium halophytocola]MBP1853414.1 LacI family transcriptional regulator [Rhizobium halophytocola]